MESGLPGVKSNPAVEALKHPRDEMIAGWILVQHQAEDLMRHRVIAGHAATLDLEIPEAEIIDLLEFVARQDQRPPILAEQQICGVAAIIAAAHFVLLVDQCRIQHVQTKLRQDLVVQLPHLAILDARFIDQDLVAVLVLQLLQQLDVEVVIRMHHDLVVFLLKPAVIIELSLAILVRHLDHGGDQLERRKIFPHMVGQ